MADATYTQEQVDKMMANRPTGHPPVSELRKHDTSPVVPEISQSGNTVTVKFKWDKNRGKVSSTGLSVVRAYAANKLQIGDEECTLQVNCYSKL